MFLEHDRQTIRLRGFDYSQPGAYFLTFCTSERAYLFGGIRGKEMRLNDLGRVALECWNEIPVHFPFVDLDEFVIMPNHMHGILWIRDHNTSGRGTIYCTPTNCAPTPEGFGKPVHGSIPTIVRTFKAAVTRFARQRTLYLGSVWQRNYYERIIHGDSELNTVRRYIVDNPLKWDEDVRNT